jgi:hypothetical protein
MKFSTAAILTGALFLIPSTHAVTSSAFWLRTSSSHPAYNHTAIGGVGTLNGTLVAGLQPGQTFPVGGSITDGVLSFKGMDSSDDQLPAYFIHGAVGSWIELNVWETPQAGYSVGSNNILAVEGHGRFYGMFTHIGARVLITCES